MTFPITGLYAAPLMIIAIGLLVWVVKGRGIAKVGIGDGGNDILIRRMRTQSNFVENAPLLLIALGLMEANGAAPWLLHTFGIILVLGRLAHPIGMTNKYPKMPFRFGGTVSVMLLYAVAAIVLFWQTLFLLAIFVEP